MHNRLLAVCAGLACASPALAQFPLQGFLYNWDRPAAGDAVSLSIRWGTTAEQTLNRIDRSDFPEWGVTTTGTTQIQGFAAWIDDANDATVESFNVVAFEESATQADFPDLAVPKLNVGPVPMPPTGTPAGPRAWRLAATLTLPVTFAGNRDVFVGIGLPAMVLATPPFDGLFLGEVVVDPANAPFPFDVPGPRGQNNQAVAQNSYICYVPTGQAARYAPPSAVMLEQLAFDVHVSSGVAGGVPLTVTQQTSYPASNVLGTSNFLSGLHPDIPRGDNIGFAVTSHTTQVAAPSLGVILLAFGPSPVGPLPLTAFGGFDPSSVGNLCVDFTTALQFFVLCNTGQTNSFANMVEGQLVLPLGANERAIVAAQPGNFDIWWQGFVIDSAGTGLEVHASACAIQHLK